jgi:hypothetical protein
MKKLKRKKTYMESDELIITQTEKTMREDKNE